MKDSKEIEEITTTLYNNATDGQYWNYAKKELNKLLTTQQDKDSSVEVKQIRQNFFDECTSSYEGIPKISLHPHNLFEWFKPYLSKPKEESNKTNTESECKNINGEDSFM